MTWPLSLALVLEAASIALLVYRLRRRIWRHLGPLFVFAAVVYHGVAEVLNRISPGGADRVGLATDQFARWQFFIGAAILLFTVAYLIVLGRSAIMPVLEVDVCRTVSFFNGKLLAAISIPMYLYVLSGHGGNSSGALQTGTSHTATGLVEQVLVITMVMASYSFVVSRRGRKTDVWGGADTPVGSAPHPQGAADGGFRCCIAPVRAAVFRVPAPAQASLVDSVVCRLGWRGHLRLSTQRLDASLTRLRWARPHVRKPFCPVSGTRAGSS